MRHYLIMVRYGDLADTWKLTMHIYIYIYVSQMNPGQDHCSSSGKAMAASLQTSFYGLGRPTPRSKLKVHQALRTRAQSSANEGN